MTDPLQIQIGDELPAFVRETGLDNWNHYAAVNDEFVPIHMDDEAGKAAGYPSAFGMGALQWAYLHDLLRSWIGEDGRILWLTDRKGRQVGVPAGKVAYVEVDPPASDRRVGFGIS